MSIWAQGCLLGNSRGEAPICHGPIIDVGHQMQLHTSAAVTCQSPLCRVSERLSLIPFDFWLIPYTQCIAMWPSAQYGHWRTLSTIREAPSPKFGSGGVFDWNEAKKLQFAVFSNISDVYTKVELVTSKYHKTQKNQSLRFVKTEKTSTRSAQSQSARRCWRRWRRWRRRWSSSRQQTSPSWRTSWWCCRTALQAKDKKRNRKSQKYLQAISLQN